MCVGALSQHERMPQDKLLFSFHKFLICLIPAQILCFEETIIRYTAFVCFLIFSFFTLFPFTCSLSHIHKYLTVKSFTKLNLKRNSALALDSGTFFDGLGVSDFTQARLGRSGLCIRN